MKEINLDVNTYIWGSLYTGKPSVQWERRVIHN